MIGKTARHWFFRGVTFGIMLCAGLNSVSYLFRTSDISHLFDQEVLSGGAIGFPFEIWNYARDSTSGSIAIGSLGMNIAFALVIGSVFGFVAVSLMPKLNRWVDEYEANSASRTELSSGKMQFSVGGMMGATALAAITFGFMTQWAGTRELLWFVYVLGPISLIAIAFLPRNIGWEARCVVLLIAATIMISGAIWSGIIRGLEFDRTLMGIFIFWTPQSAFAAVGLTTYFFVSKIRSEALNGLTEEHPVTDV